MGGKPFKFSWTAVSNLCKNVELNEFESEEERAFYINACMVCDPNTFENLGVDMKEKQKYCKSAFKMAVAEKKQAFKKKQFTWKNMEEFCLAQVLSQFEVNEDITTGTETGKEKEALMNMCSRCAGQRNGKKKGRL